MPLPTSHDSIIGSRYTELDTPALCVRLEGMEANVAAMAGFLKQHGKQWRPHAKGHKCPEIARRLLAGGAIGVTVAKTSEAVVFAKHGIRDILIANMIVGEAKLARVVELTKFADPIVAVDHFVHAEMLDDACRRAGVRCRVIAEVNVGFHRVGVRPGADTRDLTRGISRLKHIDLVGLMGYEGHLLAMPDQVEKDGAIRSAMAILGEARDQMLADGLRCDIVSAGGTGSYQVSAHCPEPTELQAGNGIFGDPFYTERCGAQGLTSSLFVLASVVSRGKLERAVLDSGRKSISQDVHPPRISRIAGGRTLPSAEITMLSAEHLRVELGEDSTDLRIGDKVEVVPGYSDFTILLHDAFFALRDDCVADVWPIEARGCLQ